MQRTAAFEYREVVVAPGTARAFDEEEWCGALVTVCSGQIELETAHGVRRTFVPGDILLLHRRPLHSLLNHGPTPAVLVAVTRRKTHDMAET